MAIIRSFLFSLGRWLWFALLIVLVLSYLMSGLSEPEPAKAGMAAVEKTGTSPESMEPEAPTNIERAGEVNLAAIRVDESIAVVDRRRQDSLTDTGLPSAPMADWMTVCRRLSLALVGSGMSVEEIRDLERLGEHRREQVHLENLLRDSRFHNYWAERYTRFLVGTDEGQFIVYRRRRFRTWLADMFAENRRYDRIASDLITAEGLWTDRPEVNFYTVTFDSGDGEPDPVRLAARTSRVFLGLRIDCLQCHNDFLGNVNLGDVDDAREGTQQDFHQLASFFSSAKVNGLQGLRHGRSQYEYQYLDAEEEVGVEPAVPFATELLPDQGNERERLAKWITHPENRQAGRAAVSHVWALMYGRPAGDSVDNLPLDQASTPILEALADDFIENDFNIRRLIRVIAGSEAFRVDSRADFEVTEEHEANGAVFPLTRLRPEQVAGCLLQSSRIKKTDRESSLIVQLQTFGSGNNFVQRYGDLGEDEFSSDSVTITQRLLTMNGKMLRESIGSNALLNASTHIDMFASDDQKAVELAYLSVLNRYPTAEESKHFLERIGNKEQRRPAIEDLFWVLLNSTELAWNH